MSQTPSSIQQIQARLAPLQRWYESRESREQLVLKLLVLVLAVCVLYWLVWAPSVAARDQAKRQYMTHQQTWQWIQANSGAVKQASHQDSDDAQPGSNWVSNVSRSADSFGLTLKGFSPDGNRAVRIQLENQSAGQTVLWLQSLTDKGINLTNVEMSPGDKPGTTTLRASLKR